MPVTAAGKFIERRFKVAVRVLTQPGDSRVFKLTPDEVVVTLTAEPGVLRELSAKNVKAYVDFTETHSAEPLSRAVQLHVDSEWPSFRGVSVTPRTVDAEEVSP